jgi:hypothetical protein
MLWLHDFTTERKKKNQGASGGGKAQDSFLHFEKSIKNLVKIQKRECLIKVFKLYTLLILNAKKSCSIPE